MNNYTKFELQDLLGGDVNIDEFHVNPQTFGDLERAVFAALAEDGIGDDYRFLTIEQLSKLKRETQEKIYELKRAYFKKTSFYCKKTKKEYWIVYFLLDFTWYGEPVYRVYEKDIDPEPFPSVEFPKENIKEKFFKEYYNK